MRIAAIALAAAGLAWQAGPDKAAVEKRIEAVFARLVTERDPAARAAARAELEAVGRPVLPVLKRFLDDELARSRKAKERAEVLADRLVPRLDDDAVDSREAATLALVELGDEVLPGLKKYEKSSSAEIRARVKAVQETIDARRKAAPGARVFEDAIVLYGRLCDPAGAALFSGFFESRDAELRLAAAKAFSEVALPADLPKLKPLLADPDLRVRAQAVRAAYDVGLDASIPMLLEIALKEPDRNVWAAALNGLGRWRALWTPDVTAKVAGLLPAAPADRRTFIVWPFFQNGSAVLPDPPAVIAEAVRKLTPQERGFVLQAQPPLAARAYWMGVYKVLSTDPDPALAAAGTALYERFLLGEFGGPGPFFERFDQLSPDYRNAALRALARDESESKPNHALPVLLRTKDPALRKAILDAAFVGSKYASGAVVRDAMLSGQPDLMAAASDLASANFLHDYRAALRYAAATAPDPALRARLAFNLAALGDPEGVAHVGPFLKDPSPRVRARAALAVRETAAPDLMDAMVPLLQDSAADVRRTAAEALLASRDPRFMATFWSLPADSDLRGLLPQAVVRLGKPADLDRLEKLLAEKPAMKPYASTALRHFSPVEPVALLAKLAEDKDPQTRENARKDLERVRAAAKLLEDLASAPKGQGLPASFDLVTAPLSSPVFVFLPREQCTAKAAAERRAIPIPLEEFLVTLSPRKYEHLAAYRSASPRACLPELLELLRADHPRFADLLVLVRTHPCPAAARKIAGLPFGGRAVAWDQMGILAQGDPVLAKKVLVERLEKGEVDEVGMALGFLSGFMPAADVLPLAARLAAGPAPRAKEWLAARPLSEEAPVDRSHVLRSAIRAPKPEQLPAVEAAVKDADPAIRALAAAALVGFKKREAVPVALDALKDAPGEAAWELAAAVVPRVVEEDRARLPADSASPAVHAVLARLGRKESVARVLEGFPASSKGVTAAAWGLAPHLDAAVEAKLAPLGDLEKDPDARLAICMALAPSQDASIRLRVMTWLQGTALYRGEGRIHPAARAAYEALIDRKEPGALERAAMYRSYVEDGIKEEALALVARGGTDEAAALLVQFLNLSMQDVSRVTPKVLAALRTCPKGPKAREQLKALLAAGSPIDADLLAPLFAELGEEAALEEALEKRVRSISVASWALGPLQGLARTPGGRERLAKLAKELAASKESGHRTTAAFAALLSGGAAAADEVRARYFQAPGSEGALLVGELRLVEMAGELLRRKREELAMTWDAPLVAALPLLTCADLRPPAHGQADYWPAMAKFLHELTAWTRKNRGRKFEEILADALRARGHAGADAKSLVAALDDPADFIAANAAWALRRVSGRAAPYALSVAMDPSGRFSVRRPDAAEIADWKKWLESRK